MDDPLREIKERARRLRLLALDVDSDFEGDWVAATHERRVVLRSTDEQTLRDVVQLVEHDMPELLAMMQRLAETMPAGSMARHFMISGHHVLAELHEPGWRCRDCPARAAAWSQPASV